MKLQVNAVIIYKLFTNLISSIKNLRFVCYDEISGLFNSKHQVDLCFD